ncbi:MAG: class I SAM-dependent methyltransferase [Candidatus Thermoplasmatota archaeon]|nr:class I SAM-dependent methyltransferase [Candidatus Thermoplasmatota archaeon]
MDHYSSKEAAENYHRSFNEEINNPAMIQKAITRYTRFIRNVKHSGHILDAGCGTGRFVKYFMRDGYRVTGIDVSKAMLKIAIRANPDAEFIEMDMRFLRFSEDYFDGIWNSGCLLHLDENGVMATLEESRRVLKQDGTFFVATRTGNEDLTREEESREGGKINVNYYTPDKLRLLLNKARFEISEMFIESDDYMRPFDYCYIYARKSK